MESLGHRIGASSSLLDIDKLFLNTVVLLRIFDKRIMRHTSSLLDGEFFEGRYYVETYLEKMKFYFREIAWQQYGETRVRSAKRLL